MDYNVKVRPLSDGTGPDIANVKMSINPFCEIGVEEAVRLREKGDVEDILAVSIGGEGAKEPLRNALALGADRGLLIHAPDDIQSLDVAKLLNAVVADEQPDIIILGKQAIDGDNNQTGQMLAALAGYPQGTFASELEIDGSQLTVTREIDGGLQTLRLSMPAVITTDLRLNEPRYASLPNIMKAKRKELAEKTHEDLGVELKSRLKISNWQLPPERKAGVRVESVGELVDKLKNEAKVI